MQQLTKLLGQIDRHWMIFGSLVLVVGTALLIWINMWPRTYALRITPGNLKSRRAHVAETLARLLKEQHLELTIAETAGAEAALDALNRHELDLALIPGGLAATRFEHVRQLAALGAEPLHLLVRKEIHPVAVQDLAALRGKRINLSKTGSASHIIAVSVLAFVGLKAPRGAEAGDYTPLALGKDELFELLSKFETSSGPERSALREELPDAAFFLDAMPSDIAKLMVHVADYRLVPLPFAEAFSLAAMANPVQNESFQIEPTFFKSVQIPACLYEVTPPVPAQNMVTLGADLLLVANEDVPKDAVLQLMQTVYETHFSTLAHPRSLTATASEFPLHSGASAYRDKDLPLVSEDTLNILAQVVTLWLFLTATFFALHRRLQADPTTRFVYYFREFTQLDLVARHIQDDPFAPKDPAERVAYLENRLSRLKSQMVEEFAESKLYRDGTMGTLMALIADTRAALTADLARIPSVEPEGAKSHWQQAPEEILSEKG